MAQDDPDTSTGRYVGVHWVCTHWLTSVGGGILACLVLLSLLLGEDLLMFGIAQHADAPTATVPDWLVPVSTALWMTHLWCFMVDAGWRSFTSSVAYGKSFGSLSSSILVDGAFACLSCGGFFSCRAMLSPAIAGSSAVPRPPAAVYLPSLAAFILCRFLTSPAALAITVLVVSTALASTMFLRSSLIATMAVLLALSMLVCRTTQSATFRVVDRLEAPLSWWHRFAYIDEREGEILLVVSVELLGMIAYTGVLAFWVGLVFGRILNLLPHAAIDVITWTTQCFTSPISWMAYAALCWMKIHTAAHMMAAASASHWIILLSWTGATIVLTTFLLTLVGRRAACVS